MTSVETKSHITFLNSKEMAWLQHREAPLKVGITQIPNQVLKSKEGYRGYAIDLFKKLESLLDIEFEYVYFDTWDSLLESGKKRDIDIVFLAQKTEQRLLLYNFTDVVLVQRNKIISNSKNALELDVEDLYGKRVSVVKNSAISEYIKLNFPQIKLLESSSETASLKLLLNGATNYTIAEPVRMSYYIEKNNIDTLHVVGSFPYDYKLRIATRNDMPIINIILNKAFEHISDVEKKSLTLKWGYEKEVFFDKKLLINILVVGMIVIFFLIYLSLLNRKLKKAQESLKRANETLEKRVQEEVEKNREKELIMLNQSRFAQMGQIVNMIAHQWKQPLNTLVFVTQSLFFRYQKNDGHLSEEEMQRFMKKMTSQIRQMSGTIDDFRDFFRPRKKRERFLVNNTLNYLIEIITPVFEMEQIVLESTQRNEVYIEGYPNELAQAILNILYNAKDALADTDSTKRKVSLLLLEEEGSVILSIRDNAGGIDEAIMHEIFNPYFSTKAQKNGTGIGLYMSKIIIEQHMNGKLYVSNSKDGALFKIVFPLA